MKKTTSFAIAALAALAPMAMQAQAIDFTPYGSTQIVNSDFEDWSGPNYKNVPVGWHSFESVGGGRLFVTFAHSEDHTSKNTDGLHEGTIGKACLKLVPRNLGIALANGTISTGRMNAGAYSATDQQRHSLLC